MIEYFYIFFIFLKEYKVMWILILIIITVIIIVIILNNNSKKRKNFKDNSINSKKNEMNNKETNSPIFDSKELSDNIENNYEKLRNLKKEAKNEEAIQLAWELVKQTENESKEHGYGVAPAPYRELAILYRKIKDTKAEIEILERYFNNTLARGKTKYELAERYKKLAEKNNYTIPKKINEVFESIN